MSETEDKKTKLSIKIILMLISCALAISFAEIVTRVYLDKLASKKVFNKYASISQLEQKAPPIYTPHRYLGYIPSPNYQNGKNNGT